MEKFEDLKDRMLLLKKRFREPDMKEIFDNSSARSIIDIFNKVHNKPSLVEKKVVNLNYSTSKDKSSLITEVKDVKVINQATGMFSEVFASGISQEIKSSNLNINAEANNLSKSAKSSKKKHEEKSKSKSKTTSSKPIQPLPQNNLLNIDQWKMTSGVNQPIGKINTTLHSVKNKLISERKDSSEAVSSANSNNISNANFDIKLNSNPNADVKNNANKIVNKIGNEIPVQIPVQIPAQIANPNQHPNQHPNLPNFNLIKMEISSPPHTEKKMKSPLTLNAKPSEAKIDISVVKKEIKLEDNFITANPDDPFFDQKEDLFDHTLPPEVMDGNSEFDKEDEDLPMDINQADSIKNNAINGSISGPINMGINKIKTEQENVNVNLEANKKISTQNTQVNNTITTNAINANPIKAKPTSVTKISIPNTFITDNQHLKKKTAKIINDEDDDDIITTNPNLVLNENFNDVSINNSVSVSSTKIKIPLILDAIPQNTDKSEKSSDNKIVIKSENKTSSNVNNNVNIASVKKGERNIDKIEIDKKRLSSNVKNIINERKSSGTSAGVVNTGGVNVGQALTPNTNTNVQINNSSHSSAVSKADSHSDIKETSSFVIKTNKTDQSSANKLRETSLAKTLKDKDSLANEDRIKLIKETIRSTSTSVTKKTSDTNLNTAGNTNNTIPSTINNPIHIKNANISIKPSTNELQKSNSKFLRELVEDSNEIKKFSTTEYFTNNLKSCLEQIKKKYSEVCKKPTSTNAGTLDHETNAEFDIVLNLINSIKEDSSLKGIKSFVEKATKIIIKILGLLAKEDKHVKDDLYDIDVLEILELTNESIKKILSSINTNIKEERPKIIKYLKISLKFIQAALKLKQYKPERVKTLCKDLESSLNLNQSSNLKDVKRSKETKLNSISSTQNQIASYMNLNKTYISTEEKIHKFIQDVRKEEEKNKKGKGPSSEFQKLYDKIKKLKSITPSRLCLRKCYEFLKNLNDLITTHSD